MLTRQETEITRFCNPHLDLLCTMCLSRVIECMRFRISEDLLDEFVTEDKIIELITGGPPGSPAYEEDSDDAKNFLHHSPTVKKDEENGKKRGGRSDQYFASASLNTPQADDLRPAREATPRKVARQAVRKRRRERARAVEAALKEAYQGDAGEGDAPPVEEFRALWTRIGYLHSEGEVCMTYRQLLRFENEAFPHTSETQRHKLLSLTQKHHVVSKDQVREALGIDDSVSDEQSAILSYLYANGAQALPSEVMQDVVGCLGVNPRSFSFANHLSSNMVRTGRRMMTLVPFLVMVILAGVYVPTVITVDHYEAARTVLHFIEADWSTGCDQGWDSPFGCRFVQRNLNTMKTVHFDVLRYVRTEFITKMWNSAGATATTTPIGYVNFQSANVNFGPVGSTYPIGALSIRLVDSSGDRESDRKNPSCVGNISEGITVARRDAKFPCDALWHVAIPFNSTQEDALTLAATVSLDPFRSLERDLAFIVQFPAYQPNTGIFVYTSVTMTLPKGGDVHTRVDVRVADAKSSNRVMGLLIINCITLGVSLMFAVYYTFHGRPFFTTDLLMEISLMSLIAASFGVFNRVTYVADLFQGSAVPDGADTMAEDYWLASKLLALWSFLVVASLSRYLLEIGALAMVWAILHHAGLQLFSMVLVFGFWTMGFALIAHVFFGNISTNLSSSFSSFTNQFEFFTIEGGAYDRLALLHPILGPLYWYTFTLFVTFFVLNLVIAVLTSPLENVKRAADLHITMHAATSMAVESDESLRWIDRQKFYFLSFLWPFVNLLYDCSPDPRRKKKWLDLDCATRHHAEVHSSHNVKNACVAGFNLLGELTTEYAMVPYETAYAKKVAESDELDPISLAYTIQTITSLTPHNVARDARLQKALVLYDGYTTDVNDLVALQKDLREASEKMTTLTEKDQREASSPKFAEQLQSSEFAASLATNGSFGNPPASEPETPLEQETPVSLADAATEPPMEKPEPNHSKTSVFAPMASSTVAENTELTFFFTEHLVGYLGASRFQFVRFGIVVVVFLWFFITGFSTPTDTAYLASSVRDGLERFPIMQECFDANCTSTFSFRKTFRDTGDVADWYVWVEKVLLRQLYFRQTNLNESSGVFWDPRTTVRAPVYFRQLRGAGAACDFGTGKTSASPTTVRQRIASTVCSSTPWENVFSDADFVPTVTSTLKADAYKYRETCPEVRKGRHFGATNTFPCAGYTVGASNASDVEAILRAKWVDEYTRFIAVTATFDHAGRSVEYTLITELGVGGGTAHVQSLVVSLSEDRGTMEALVWAPLALMSLDIIVFVAFSLRLIRKNGIQKFRPPVDFPMSVLVTLILTAVLPYIIYGNETYNERLKIQLGVMTLSLLHRATKDVFFPVAGLLSKEPTKLFETFQRSLKQCAMIIPFYLIFLTGFMFAGMVAFAVNINGFQHFRFALITVLRAAFDDWDDAGDIMNNFSRPEASRTFNIILYATILVMLSNLVLAMVTSAATDAVSEGQSVELAERIAATSGFHVFHGGIAELMIGWSVWWASKFGEDSSATFRRDSPIAYSDTRILFLVESMTTALGPYRTNEILLAMRMDQIPIRLFPTAVVFVLKRHAMYTKKRMVEEGADRKRERLLLYWHSQNSKKGGFASSSYSLNQIASGSWEPLPQGISFGTGKANDTSGDFSPTGTPFFPKITIDDDEASPSTELPGEPVAHEPMGAALSDHTNNSNDAHQNGKVVSRPGTAVAEQPREQAEDTSVPAGIAEGGDADGEYTRVETYHAEDF